MSKLSKFAKSIYRFYLECEKTIDKKELIDYTEKLLFGEKVIFYEIPLAIKNKADNLFDSNKQTSSDEKILFQKFPKSKNFNDTFICLLNMQNSCLLCWLKWLR